MALTICSMIQNLPVLTLIALTLHALKTCDENKWSCFDGRRCIEKEYVCDKHFHCTDGSDEMPEVCALWQCARGKWKCGNNKCIDEDKVCDGIISFICEDGSDEAEEICSAWNCTDGLWKCKHHKCISSHRVCNGRNDDCRDDSDEEPDMCKQWTCLPGHWKCDNMKCITETHVCDGATDPMDACEDESDEGYCEGWVCPQGYWKCDDMTCIEEVNVCDGSGIGGCQDYSDEAHCQNYTCPAGKWKCDNMLCIDEMRLCDSSYFLGCLDKSDETHCEDLDCPERKWKCLNGKTCIFKKRVCDGMSHCRDESDEDPSVCQNWTCLPGYWKCHDQTKCILEAYNILDGYSQCKDGSDEIPEFHIKSSCGEGEQLCNNSFQCISSLYWCDGDSESYYSSCRDGSDEGSHCALWECYQNRWKCAHNPKCIWNSQVCDGRYDCRDKSDEHNSLCVCHDEEWPCKDGDGCAKSKEVCDGIPNCNDKSDEYESVCILWNCSGGQNKCKDNKRCVSFSETCDGKEDCLDGSDETKCELFTCLNGTTKCADRLQCIEQNEICDGVMHCRDGSDELCMSPCTESKIIGRSIMRRCSEDISKCFPVDRYCDGVPDCPYGSDEVDSGCSCKDWDMINFKEAGHDLCIYKEWTFPMKWNARYNFSDVGSLHEYHDATVWNSTMDGTQTDCTSLNMIINNIDLENTTIGLCSGRVVIANCSFKGVGIRGALQNCKSGCHIELIVQNSIFQCPTADLNCTNTINLNSMSILKMAILESRIHHMEITVFTRGMMLTVTECYFSHISVQIKVRSDRRVPSIINIEHTTVANSFQTSVFDVYNPHVTFSNCTFTGTSIEIFAKKAHYRPDLLYINILQAIFQKGLKEGNGGGLLIHSEAKWSSVELSHAVFLDNILIEAPDIHTGKGGALFVHGEPLDLTITNSKFAKNSAPREGSAIFLSEGVSATIVNT